MALLGAIRFIPHPDDCDCLDCSSVAEQIRLDNEARLDQMEHEMGIEPANWQDSY